MLRDNTTLREVLLIGKCDVAINSCKIFFFLKIKFCFKESLTFPVRNITQFLTSRPWGSETPILIGALVVKGKGKNPHGPLVGGESSVANQ